MKLQLKRGFTLIELLVVIAIIGIFASVVLASLNSARDGADAAIKSTINNVRAQAAIHYEDNSNYDSFCASLTAAQDSVNNAGGTGTWACNTDAATDSTTYAVSGELSTGDFYCVDSTGSASTTAAAASGGGC